jgi:hypothetical protein
MLWELSANQSRKMNRVLWGTVAVELVCYIPGGVSVSDDLRVFRRYIERGPE